MTVVAVGGTARRQRNNLSPSFGKFPMTASTTILEGALVSVTLATGLAINSTDAAAQGCVGICTKTVTSAATGTTYVEVEYGHEELMATNIDMSALIGTRAFVFDNNTVTSAVAAQDVAVGTVQAVESATQAWIKILGPTTL